MKFFSGRTESIPQPEISQQDKDKEAFDDYVSHLDLREEDLRKTILDVGSGKGRFAKYAKDHNINSEIYSADPNPPTKAGSKAVRALGEQLPFKDGQFDLVVSNASFPAVFINPKEIWDPFFKENNPAPLESRLKQALNEFLRVIKINGEVRLGRVQTEGKNKANKAIELIFSKILDELVAGGEIEMEKIPKEYMRARDFTDDPIKLKGDPDEVLMRLVLLKIKKLK